MAGELLGLQRQVGNRTTVSLLRGRPSGGPARSALRIQRATRCSTWWADNAGGRAAATFGEPDLRLYWATLKPDFDVLGLTLRPTGVLQRGDLIAQLDVLADFLNDLVAFWNDTAELRETIGVTDTVASLVDLTSEERAKGFQTARELLGNYRESWTMEASQKASFESSKSAMKNACTLKLLNDHIVGYPDAIDDPAVLVAASRIARGRDTNFSTVINLSDGAIRKDFEDEIAGTFEAKSADLETISFYPVVHIDKRKRLQQVGRARVRITRDKEGKLNKRFHHLSEIIGWQGGEPAATAWN